MDSERRQSSQSLPVGFSRLGVWAFSIGTSIGWSSFVVTCSTYLSQAGTAGTVIGLVLGMAVILVVTHNLCYMMERAPDAGGIYTYGRLTSGHDTGFLVAWFLLLTYLAVLWASVSSLPLFVRGFVGSALQFGYCYSVFDYDVYLGETLLSVAVILLIGLLCMRSRRLPRYFMIGMAVLFTGCVIICGTYVLLRHPGGGFSYDPAYIPDKRRLGQILRIAVISPWAFIGYENVTHYAEEFTFPVKKIRGVMLASVLFTTLFYILMSLLSAAAYPARYGTWLEYIRDMNNLEGLEGIPAFYAASRYMGRTGVTLMMLSLLSVILTSLIGNLTAISRLLFAFGRDHAWAHKLGSLNKKGIPGRAMLAVVLVSCLIPLLGRTAISWIIDVTTLGATIIYGFQSSFVFRDARSRGDRREVATGAAGTLMMFGFAVLLLAPKLISYEAMAAESYFLFVAWSFLGLVVFRLVLLRDRGNNYGHSVIVWIVLLLVMLMTTMMWKNREIQRVTDQSMGAIQQYYQQRLEPEDVPEEDARFLQNEAARIERANSRWTSAAYLLFMAAVLLMIGNYRAVQKREMELESQLGAAKESSLTDSLTGVKNKHAYTQWEARLDRAIRQGEAEPFAVVVCDINDLKKVNDIYGHRKGDECIRRACSHICGVYSHSPVFRYGGDEFVVLLFGEDYARRDSLLERVSMPPGGSAAKPGGTIAAGMAEYRAEDAGSLSAVFERADDAMYERKKQMHGQPAPANAGV